MLKAVFDTNVLISALIKEGIPNQILLYAGEKYQLCICQEIIDEFREVIKRPKIQKLAYLTMDKITNFLSDIQNIAHIVNDIPSIDIIKADPDDNTILACALKAQADYIISGDRHLKQLGFYKDIQIVSPVAFSNILNT
jgi:putative PIN family toxin of toxin-antitoxin system